MESQICNKSTTETIIMCYVFNKCIAQTFYCSVNIHNVHTPMPMTQSGAGSTLTCH